MVESSNKKNAADAARAPRDLQLLIKPVSGRCNLRCEYCFYRPVHESLFPEATVMSGEVLEEMIRQTLALGLPHTSFSWQGGEPTLAGIDFFKEAVRIMMKHGRSGQAVGNAFQTNGILLDDRWADFFARYSFLVGVSIDGPADVHDRYRGKTLQRVIRNAHTAMKLGVEVNVLSCVSRAAEGRAKEIYDFLHHEQEFAHLQFIPIVEFAGAPGTPAEFNCRPEAYGDFLIELFETWRADPHPACIRLFDSLIELAGTGRCPFCILAPRCASYVVVEASGDIYPCDFFVREELRLGNVMEMQLIDAHSTPRAREFAKLKGVRPEKCKACEWWRVCRGGCLKEREVAGGLDAPTYLCEGNKRFFEHAWSHFEVLGRRHFGTPERPRSPVASQATPDARATPDAPSAGGGSQATPRPRPNDPCSCGSGRKFKRCCGRR